MKKSGWFFLAGIVMLVLGGLLLDLTTLEGTASAIFVVALLFEVVAVFAWSEE